MQFITVPVYVKTNTIALGQRNFGHFGQTEPFSQFSICFNPFNSASAGQGQYQGQGQYDGQGQGQYQAQGQEQGQVQGQGHGG